MAWCGLEGVERAVERFRRGLRSRRLGSAYLFCGPAGVGKRLCALQIAKGLLCERRDEMELDPCLECPSCLQIEAGTHPDVDRVGLPEGKTQIPLELLIGDAEHRMREGLCHRISLRPLRGRRRVAIIDDADHLNVSGANALLKTLEEPPPGAILFLISSSPQRQLPTIRSRCQVIRFTPLPAEVVRSVIERESQAAATPVDSATLDACGRHAGGSLSRARLLLDPDVTAFRTRLLELLARRPLPGVELARDTTAFVEAAGKEAPPRRARMRIVIDEALDVFRGAIRGAPAVGDAPQRNAVAAWAADPDAASSAIDATLAAAADIDRFLNVNVVIDAWTAVLEEPRLARSG